MYSATKSNPSPFHSLSFLFCLLFAGCGGSHHSSKISNDEVRTVFEYIKSSVPAPVRDDLILSDIIYLKKTPVSSHGFTYVLTHQTSVPRVKANKISYYQETAFLHACQYAEKVEFWERHKLNSHYLFKDDDGINFQFTVLYTSCAEFRSLNKIKT